MRQGIASIGSAEVHITVVALLEIKQLAQIERVLLEGNVLHRPSRHFHLTNSLFGLEIGAPGHLKVLFDGFVVGQDNGRAHIPEEPDQQVEN